jgi:hypothetical protein
VKERAQLEEMYHRGYCPWMIWDADRSAGVPAEGIALDGPGPSAAGPLPTSALR